MVDLSPFQSKFQNMSKIRQQTPEILASERRPTFRANCNLKTSHLLQSPFLLSSNSYIHTFMNRNDFCLFSDFQILKVLFPWLTAVNWKFLKTTARTTLKLTAINQGNNGAARTHYHYGSFLNSS